MGNGLPIFPVAVIAVLLVACAQNPKTYSEGRCGGTPSDWQQQGSEFGELMSRNVLEVSPNTLRWNGGIIGPKTLRALLSEAKRLDPPPNLVVVFDSRTRCDVVQAVRRGVNSNLKCDAAPLSCVEYGDAEWRKALPPPP